MGDLKSNLCKQWDPHAEKEFGEDLEKTFALEALSFSLLAKQAARVEAAPSEKETESAVAAAANALGHTRAEIVPPLRIASFFLRQFQSAGKANKDDPRDIASDLAHKKLVPNDRVTEFGDFLTSLKREVDRWLDIGKLKRRIARRGMAHLSGIGTAADFRAVFREQFTVETDFNHYNPTCLGVVPVGLVTLGLDEGPIEQIAFQVDRRALALLINHLRALEKELSIAQQSLSLEELPEKGENQE